MLKKRPRAAKEDRKERREMELKTKNTVGERTNYDTARPALQRKRRLEICV